MMTNWISLNWFAVFKPSCCVNGNFHDSHNIPLLCCTVCGQLKTDKLSKSISPSGELQYRPGDDVVLNCSFYPVRKVGERPNWFYIDYSEDAHGQVKCVNSNNTSQEYHYDNRICSWKNTLTIYNFSKELSGTYSCGFSYHIINQTLKLLEKGN